MVRREMMKEEVQIQVRLKGGEFSFNGGPRHKAPFNLPLVERWIEVKKPRPFTFKIGRREYMVKVERI